MKFGHYKNLAATVVMSMLPVFVHAGEEKSPYILLIVADDLKHSNIASFGTEIETLSLDELANSGFINDRVVTMSELSQYFAERLASKGLSKDQAWGNLTPEQREIEIRAMEIYEEMLDEMDTFTGMALDHIIELLSLRAYCSLPTPTI